MSSVWQDGAGWGRHRPGILRLLLPHYCQLPGEGVQLKSNGLDPSQGLVAVDAERVVSHGWLAAAVQVALVCNLRL